MQFFETRSSNNQLEYPYARIELLFWLTYFYIPTQQNLFESLCKERKKHLLWLSTRYFSLPPRYFCSTFDRVLKNIYIPLKEMQLKSMNGKTIFIDTYFFFQSEIFTCTKTEYLRILIMENVYIFPLLRSHQEYLAQFLKVTMRVCCNTKSLQKLNFFNLVS